MTVYLDWGHLDGVLNCTREWSMCNHSATITVRDRYAEDRCIGFAVSQDVDTNSVVSLLCVSLFRMLTEYALAGNDAQELLTDVHVNLSSPHRIIYFPGLKMLDTDTGVMLPS